MICSESEKLDTPACPAHVQHVVIVLTLALVPFLAKGIVLALGLTGYGLQSIYKLFQLAAPCFWRFRWRGARGLRVLWPTDEPLPDGPTWLVASASGVALGVAGIAAAVWLLPLTPIDPIDIRAGLDERFPMGPYGAVLVVIFLSLVNSALEELHFRAWLDRELTACWGQAAGISISAAAFGGMHVLIFLGTRDLPAIAVCLVPIALAGAGAVWSAIMRRPGGIHAAWLSHALTDAILLGWGLHWLGYI